MLDEKSRKAAEQFGIMPVIEALERNLLALDGISEIEYDLSGFWTDLPSIIFLPKRNLNLSSPDWYGCRSKLLSDVLTVMREHGLERTGDRIEDYGEHWYIVSKLAAFTLRNKIAEAKSFYWNKYGKLDWQWTNEGLPNAVLDYHSSKGGTVDFTEDDWKVCEENGWTRAEVEALCKED